MSYFAVIREAGPGQSNLLRPASPAAFREALPAGGYLAPACGARRVTPGGATG